MPRYTHVEETIDNHTGETKTVKKSYSVKIKTPRFTMLFVEDAPIDLLLKVKRAVDFKLLLLLCKKAEFNNGIVEMSAPLREEIENKLGIDKSAFSQSKKRLQDLGIIATDR